VLGYELDSFIISFCGLCPESMTVKIDGEGIMKGPDPVSSFFKYWTRGRRMKNPWKDAENNVMAPFDVDVRR